VDKGKKAGKERGSEGKEGQNAEDTARSRLRSAARGDLQVPRSKTNFGSRAFAVAGPMFWNRLPPEIRANDSLQSFKSQLKTYYF